MLTLALPTFASAILCWPVRPAARRLRLITGPKPTARRWSWPQRPPSFGRTLTVALPAAVAWLLTGPGVAIAVAVTAATLRSRLRARGKAKARLAAATALADALRALVAELRAGAHPATAAEGAAADAREPAATVLTTAAGAARLGADVAEALRGCVPGAPELDTALRPLAHAWSLAQRHGLPLAEVLDAVQRDVSGRLRFSRQVHARMAGPRASGAVLAVLPVLGVLLGEGMGAGPIHILMTTSIGQILLALGTLLACAGVLWIAKLTSRAVLS